MSEFIYIFGLATAFTMALSNMGLGMSVKPQHRVTAMNGAWNSNNVVSQQQAVLAVQFEA